jgi:hypothetical protein
MRYLYTTSEGGFLPIDILDRVVAEDLAGQRADDFGLPRGRRLLEEIASTWSDAQKYWDTYRRRRLRVSGEETGTSVTREQWLIPLLSLLDYHLAHQPAAVVLDGRTYAISHRTNASALAPPVHTEGFRVDLDYRPRSGRLRLSPQALVQEYLNRTEHLWGIVTNGSAFRLLRQLPRTSRPSYLEFNLEGIMESNSFSEFALFYRLCHRSRLPREAQDGPKCLLERYFQEGIEQGARVRERLRDGVEQALVTLGTGLLRHPANARLRTQLEGDGSNREFYRQLLRLVYRLLFLMVIEERQLVFAERKERGEEERIYRECYSVSRLRELAEHRIDPGSFVDLWLGLWQSFRLFLNGEGTNVLGVSPLNGDLFGREAIPWLEGTLLLNGDLVQAIRHLSQFDDRGTPRRVNYAALDVEELGSVYESLLDYQPVVLSDDFSCREFTLQFGSERRTTGSYYTHKSLVSELVESAMVPVMEERLRAARTTSDKEKALLGLTICDPASGSGHFLLAAARRLGRELAVVRTGEQEPTPAEFRAAVRDVIAHCIFAVDINPLAVDLCKLALWLEGHNAGKPLSFLDHHVRCGNSLLGVYALEEVLDRGIPGGAFQPVFGDEKRIAAELSRQNLRQQRSRQLQLVEDPTDAIALLSGQVVELASIRDDSAASVRLKHQWFIELRAQGSVWWRYYLAASAWTAAFFALLQPDQVHVTHNDVQALVDGNAVVGAKGRWILAVAEDNRFFHWPLEFPEVFARGGFAVVLGNPPWERIKIQEEEFFAHRAPDIAHAPNRAARQRLIAKLAKERPALWKEFCAAKHAAEAQGKFFRHSLRFPLSARGDINTYALFAELSQSLLGPGGRAGMVVPTGVATDHTCRELFGRLVGQGQLVSLFDFENRRGLFPAVDARYRFCLLTTGKAAQSRGRFAFTLTDPEQIREEQRLIELGPGDFQLFNPNTMTCPIFRTRYDLELTRKIYEQVPVLVNETTRDNPWNVEFLRMFDMSGDSGLFQTRAELEAAGYLPESNWYSKAGQRWLPLYEAKLLHQFDHRWGTYQRGQVRDCTTEEKANPQFEPEPRYWVAEEEVERRLAGRWERRWLLAFRNITNATNERTAIFSVIPRAGAGHSTSLVWWSMAEAKLGLAGCLLANTNALVYDYVTRQKLAGTNMSYYYIEQIPVLPPSRYGERDRAFITRRVVALSYASASLKSFAQDMGYPGDPVTLSEATRARLRAELDAYYAHLYGLTRDELHYILDPQEVMGPDFPGETFRVLKANELAALGEYRTKRLVLEAYDRLSAAGWSDTT